MKSMSSFGCDKKLFRSDGKPCATCCAFFRMMLYPWSVALERIKKQVEESPVIIYMKGTPQMPMCGFSSRTVEALKSCGKEFSYVNVILDSEIMQELPKFADWPTFPQLYIKGELIGGCDITLDLHKSGELQKMIDEAVS